MALVFLGLGSNLQDRLDNLNQAITLLSELEQTTVTAVSNYYESPALLKEGAPEEWNWTHLIYIFKIHISVNTTLANSILLLLS